MGMKRRGSQLEGEEEEWWVSLVGWWIGRRGREGDAVGGCAHIPSEAEHAEVEGISFVGDGCRIDEEDQRVVVLGRFYCLVMR